jgi:hypothetical protein
MVRLYCKENNVKKLDTLLKEFYPEIDLEPHAIYKVGPVYSTIFDDDVIFFPADRLDNGLLCLHINKGDIRGVVMDTIRLQRSRFPYKLINLTFNEKCYCISGASMNNTSYDLSRSIKRKKNTDFYLDEFELINSNFVGDLFAARIRRIKGKQKALK